MTVDFGIDTDEPMGTRATLANLLTDALDVSVRVVESAQAVTPEIGHDLVLIALDEVKPSKYNGARTVTISVLCAVAKSAVGLADDALEEHLADVLDVLDDIGWVNWTSAKRAVYQPSEDSAGFPAFTITIEIEVH